MALAANSSAAGLAIHFRQLWEMFCTIVKADSNLAALQMTAPRDHLIRTLKDPEVRRPVQMLWVLCNSCVLAACVQCKKHTDRLHSLTVL